MRDKRPVDELSIEELERILAIRKREERQGKLQRMQRAGRVVATEDAKPASPVLPVMSAVTSPATAPAKAKVQPVKSASDKEVSPRFEDEPEGLETAGKHDKDRFWKAFVNQSLLLVEILAVVGLVYLGYNMLTAIGKLEQETASAQQLADEQRRATLPTIAPTPQLQLNQVVLPGGHTPPTAPGGAAFNFNEIPSNLLPLVQSQILQPVINRPIPTDETALHLSIPKLNIDHTIVQGVDWEALKLGIGQVLNNVNPDDDTGNVVLAAHNDIYGELFRHLDQLEVGDEFFIRTQTKIFTYRITGWDTYEPNDVHVMNSRGTATATLISCYPYQVNDKRIVVFADRVDSF